MNFQAARKRMVERQIAARGIHAPAILDAFLKVPRHLFVPVSQRTFAYQDGPMPIGLGQTISQPYVVAYMTALLDLKGDEKVLEIGTGSGYQAAILGELAGEVHTVERHPELAEDAEERLQSLGYENITTHIGDGTAGLPDLAPFQAVMVTAAASIVPTPLLDQLDQGGCLVMPVGGRGSQVLQRFRRAGEGFESERLTPVAFVPLIGEYTEGRP